MVIFDLSIFFFQAFKINLLVKSKPLSIKIAPIKASHASLKIYSSSIEIFNFVLPVFIKFCRPNSQATSQQVFFLTKLAKRLSRTPSVSFGYKSNNFFDKIKPSTLSPKNSHY